jgi:phosphoglycerate dehydrogenase-like enzyme
VIGHCGGEVKGPLPAALFSRLTITNAPAPMARPVAEMAVALLLYSVRNVDGYRDALRGRSNAIYARLHRDGAGDETLHGRAIGLLGFGKIGRGIAGPCSRPSGCASSCTIPSSPRARSVAPERPRPPGDRC